MDTKAFQGQMIIHALDKAIEADQGFEGASEMVRYCHVKMVEASDKEERKDWSIVAEAYMAAEVKCLDKGKSARARMVKYMMEAGMDQDDARNMVDERKYACIRSLAESWIAQG